MPHHSRKLHLVLKCNAEQSLQQFKLNAWHRTTITTQPRPSWHSMRSSSRPRLESLLLHTTVVLAPGDPSAWQIGSHNLSSTPFRVWETGALIVICDHNRGINGICDYAEFQIKLFCKWILRVESWSDDSRYWRCCLWIWLGLAFGFLCGFHFMVATTRCCLASIAPVG